MQGKVIQYTKRNGIWTLTNEINPPTSDSKYYHFGESIDCQGDRLVVAADYDKTYRYTGGAVFIFNVPSLTHFVDTICQGDSYLFQDSTYFTTGFYTDTLNTIYGADSIISLDLTVIPQEHLVIDTILCNGDSIQIGDSLIVESGHYEFYFNESYNCQSTALIDILFDTLELKDTIISDYGCHFGKIDLEIMGNNPPFAYSWNNGEVTEDLVSLSSGFYYLKITTNSECKYDFEFEVKEERDLYIIPNAFFPGGFDEINKTFKVYLADSVNIVLTEIFNRWGEKVYQTHDNTPWDGTFKGIELPPEVYLYIIIVDTPCGPEKIKGQVMLLR
jgi:gliding motility-associated-like protein